jgi:hypothetical protein
MRGGPAVFAGRDATLIGQHSSPTAIPDAVGGRRRLQT